MNKTEYIRKMYSILAPMCHNYGYYNVACGMIAQSIQEGWNSGLATKYHNYWGMKAGKSYKCKTVAMNNKAGNDPAVYRAYSSMEEGCRGYFDFLAYSRYQPLKQCKTDMEYLELIGPCGWNSNPGYGNRCISHLKEVYDALGQETEQKTLPVLRRGDHGDAVLAWQNLLKLHKYYNGEPDGIFGRLTEEAVYNWQKDHPECGKPDGIIGKRTWASIGL